jgi:hypothetical protein
MNISIANGRPRGVREAWVLALSELVRRHKDADIAVEQDGEDDEWHESGHYAPSDTSKHEISLKGELD